MFEGKSILVVDDEPDLREILCEEFQMLGARVESAANGRDALKIYQTRPSDIVISDLRMPGGDGVALARALKSETHAPVVVLVTGFADLLAEEAFAIGAEGFLTKPFLLDLVRENLQRLMLPAAQRWSKPSATPPVLLLDAPAAVYQGHSEKEIFGRGGFFFSGSGLPVRAGQEVSFRAAGIEGTGLVRWVRASEHQGLGPGVGIEFNYLDSASLSKVLSFIGQFNPQAFIPLGF